MTYRKDKDSDLWHVPCAPKQGVVRSTPYVRALGKWVEAGVVQEPDGQAQADLVGDLFAAHYQPKLEIRSDVRPDRLINQKIVEWAQETPGFEEARSACAGDILASSVSGGMLWTTLVQDDTLKKILEKQKEAEEAEKQADEALKEMAKAAQAGDNEGVAKAQQKAKDAQDKASAAAQAGAGAIDKLKRNPLAKGMMQSAVKQAQEGAKESQEAAAGWGLEPGQMSEMDTKEIMKYASNPKLKEIARLAGRLRGLSSRTIEGATRSYTGTVTEPDYTQKIEKLFPTERMYLSPNTTPMIRAQKVCSFLEHGALGWRPVQEGKIEGAFVAAVDRSGSMQMYNGQNEIVAKAIALGIAFALSGNEQVRIERSYEIFSFASDNHFPSVTSKQEIKDHIEWAAKSTGGGTDFDAALNYAMGSLRRMHADGVKGADLLFITDGEAYLSGETEKAWKELAAESGARLIYIQVEGRMNEQVQALADKCVLVASPADFEKNAGELVVSITEDIVGAGERLLAQTGD